MKKIMFILGIFTVLTMFGAVNIRNANADSWKHNKLEQKAEINKARAEQLKRQAEIDRINAERLAEKSRMERAAAERLEHRARKQERIAEKFEHRGEHRHPYRNEQYRSHRDF